MSEPQQTSFGDTGKGSARGLLNLLTGGPGTERVDADDLMRRAPALGLCLNATRGSVEVTLRVGRRQLSTPDIDPREKAARGSSNYSARRK